MKSIAYYRNLIEQAGLECDPWVMHLFARYARNPEHPYREKKLRAAIERHPLVKMQRLSGCPFPPAPERLSAADAIVLGKSRSGRPAHIKLEAFDGHALIAGDTGSGKTELLRNITIQLARQGHRVIWLDYKKDERQMLPYMEDLLILRIGEDANWAINLTEPWPGVSVRQWDELLIKCMVNAFFLGEGSSSILHDSLTAARSESTTVTLPLWLEKMQQAKKENYRTAAWKVTAERPIRSLLAYPALVDCVEGIPLWEIYERYHVGFEMDAIDDEPKIFWGGFLLASYFTYLLANDLRKD